MGWEEAVLGGIQGLTNQFGQAMIAKDQKNIDQQDKRKSFQQDILKGVILEAMKPKGRGVTFGDDLVEAAPDLVDPQFVKILQALKVGGGKGGSGSSGGGGAPRSPFGMGGRTPMPSMGGGNGGAPAGGRIRLKPLGS